MEKLKISVIGTRHAGCDFHLPGLSKFNDVDLSICDIDPDTLRYAGDKFNIAPEKRYTDYQQMLKKEDPQGVLVLMAQYSHSTQKARPPYFKIVNEVMDQKRAIMVEKPLAMSTEEAKPLVEKAEKLGLITMVSQNRRFNPLVQLCKREIEMHGPMLNAICCFYKGYNKDWGIADMLTSDMIHALDLMRYVMGGDIVEFHPVLAKTEFDPHPSAFHAMAVFDNGGTGMFTGNVSVGDRVQSWQLHGLGMSAFIQCNLDVTDPGPSRQLPMSARIVRQQQNAIHITDAEAAMKVWGEATFQITNGFTGANRHFIKCIKTGKQTECSFADNYKTVDCCEKILKSKLHIVTRR